jgi:hypothetical protein
MGRVSVCHWMISLSHIWAWTHLVNSKQDFQFQCHKSNLSLFIVVVVDLAYFLFDMILCRCFPPCTFLAWKFWLDCFLVFQQSQHIWHHLAMFFRDELLSWSWRRPLGIPSVPVAAGMINPSDFQQKVVNNVDHVINRIKSISPHYLAEEVCYFLSLDLCLSRWDYIYYDASDCLVQNRE